MGYDISKTNLKPRFVLDLLEIQDELSSMSEITKVDDIELQEIVKSTENLIFQINNQSQMDDLFEDPLCDLLRLDKQLRSIRGSLKVEVAKKVQFEENIKKEHHKLKEFRGYPGVYGNDQLEEIRNRIERLSEDLKVRQESIDLLKGRLKNQITSFKETICQSVRQKRSERYLESKELQSGWLSVYLLKHYYQVWVVALQHQEVVSLLLRMRWA